MAEPLLNGLVLRLLSRLAEWPLVGRLLGGLSARRLRAPLTQARDDLPPPLWSPDRRRDER